MTYTYAILPVTPKTYREIAQKLKEAGYEQAFHEEEEKTVIDMHGIALAEDPAEIDLLKEKAVALAMAVNGLFDFISKDHSLDIEDHDRIVRKAYDELAALLKSEEE